MVNIANLGGDQLLYVLLAENRRTFRSSYAALKSAAVKTIFGSVNMPSPRLVRNSKSRQRLREPLLAGFELFHSQPPQALFGLF